jgi:hypothetical protein
MKNAGREESRNPQQSRAVDSHRTPSLAVMAAVDFVPPTGKQCHVYISHAGETRQDLVHFLREAIASTSPALHVFLEEHPLPPSRGMRPTALAALQDAFVGESRVVVAGSGEKPQCTVLHETLWV